MTIERIVIQITAIVFLLYGLAFCISPTEMFLLVNHATLSTSSAIIDVRSTFGGMTLAMGFSLFYLDLKRIYIKECLLLIIIIVSFMMITRGYGLLHSHKANTLMSIYFLLELAVVIIAGGLYYRLCCNT